MIKVHYSLGFRLYYTELNHYTSTMTLTLRVSYQMIKVHYSLGFRGFRVT